MEGEYYRSISFFYFRKCIIYSLKKILLLALPLSGNLPIMGSINFGRHLAILRLISYTEIFKVFQKSFIDNIHDRHQIKKKIVAFDLIGLTLVLIEKRKTNHLLGCGS